MTNSKKMMLNVSKRMLAKDLKGIVNLPNYDDNQIVEIIVTPKDEEKALTRKERSQILKEIHEIMLEAKKNPDFDPNKTREDYRMERLAEKYEAFN